MAVTRGTLQIARRLRRGIGTEVDTLDRQLTRAWVTAWDDLAPAWQRAASDLVAEAQRLEHWPRPTDIARLDRVMGVLDASEEALVGLADQTRDGTGATADRVIDADVELEPRIIASQAPAAEREALLVHIAGRVAVAVAEQDRDTVRVQAVTRIRTDAIDVIRNRTQGQITATTLPLSTEATEAMRRELIRGVDVGANPREAAARMVGGVEGRFNGGLTRALNISRTEILDAYRSTSMQIHNANRDIVPGWEWLASLDRRVCISCASLHGTRYPVSEPGPQDHQQGRCSRLPVLASWAELGIKAPEPPSAMRDSQAWFDGLPQAAQLQIMGPARLQLYRDGRVGWGDLSTTRQTPGWRPSRAPTPVRDLQRRADRGLPPTPGPTTLTRPAAQRPRITTPTLPQSSAPLTPTARDLTRLDDGPNLTAAAKQVYEGTFAGIRTTVTEVRWMDPPANRMLGTTGELRDAAGAKVGDFSRVITVSDDGSLVAYHDILEINPRIQGQGFAKAFNSHLERWYRASGIDRIELYANIDVGGYAWARAGYDFARARAAERVMHRLRRQIDPDGTGPAIPPADLAAARDLLARAEQIPFGDPGYPTAYEVSQLGRPQGAGRDDSWLGKRVLLGSAWDAVKPL